MIRILANGTVIRARNGRCITRLPNGRILRACANAETATMAERLGYGSDLAACVEQHDALHAIVIAAIGLPYSLSLMAAAGEDVPAKHGAKALPASYHGLRLTNLYVLTAAGTKAPPLGYAGSGFERGTTSGSQVVYGGYGKPATIAAPAGRMLSLTSAQITAAWCKALQVDVTGYDAAGKAAQHQLVTVTDGGPSLVAFGWSGLARVTFSPSACQRDPAMGGEIGKHVVLDDVVVSTAP